MLDKELVWGLGLGCPHNLVECVLTDQCWVGTLFWGGVGWGGGRLGIGDLRKTRIRGVYLQ